MRDWKIIKWMFICVITCAVPYLTLLVIPIEIPNWYGWFAIGTIAYFFGVCLFAK